MKAILLVNFGSPEKLQDCRDFYTNMFSDKHILPVPFILRKFIAWKIAKKSYEKSWSKYQLINGSPMNNFMSCLRDHLADDFKDYQVVYANSYLKPFIKDAVKDLLSLGLEELLVLPLYPQYSDCTTGSVMDDVNSLLKKRKVKVNYIKNFYKHPAYLYYFSEKLRKHIERESAKDAVFIYSAHSVPMSLIEKGDPYQRETEEFNALIAEKLGHEVNNGYQSQAGKGKWLGPGTKELIDKFAETDKGRKMVLVPVSFCGENLETKYDLDHVLVPYAMRKGVHASRLKLGTAKEFAKVCRLIISDYV